MSRRTLVFGPAYLDRFLVVDRPLSGPGDDGPLDQSLEGVWTFGEGLRLFDAAGSVLEIAPPDGWPGPTGAVTLRGVIGEGPGGWRRPAQGIAWHDDLGGMGAGLAAALGGELVCVLGAESDPTSQSVEHRLLQEGIQTHPIREADHPADWTLMVASGPHGDKLGVGFRGCHAAAATLCGRTSAECDLRVVAALPNRLAAEALRESGSRVRVFAPAMRNMIDREVPVSQFARFIDILCCNRREWEQLDDREQVAWQVSILAVTDGPHGSVVRFTTPLGEAGRLTIPAFPRRNPPRDTTRAGETYAATLIATVLDHGWSPGVTDPELLQAAATRASAAAALVLDRREFGFPSPSEIDAALAAGCVGGVAETADDPRRFRLQ